MDAMRRQTRGCHIHHSCWVAGLLETVPIVLDALVRMRMHLSDKPDAEGSRQWVKDSVDRNDTDHYYSGAKAEVPMVCSAVQCSAVSVH